MKSEKLLVLFGVLATTQVHAQSVRGVVAVAESDSLLEGATVQLVDPSGTPLAMFLTEGDQTIDIRVNLAPQVTLLDPVTIFGQTAETPGQREFLSRRNLKWGYSFSRTEIEQLRAGTVTDVLRLETPLVISRCMDVYLDGSQSKIFGDSIPLDWVYGIEVYPGHYDIPLEYRNPDPKRHKCGAVLLWSTTIGKD
ncbi:MAG: hypothetical protein ACE5HT_14545 [Gemmatimonadales bacterium]